MKQLKYILTVFSFLIITTSIQAQSPVADKSGIGPRIGYYKAPDAEDGTMFIGAQTRFRGDVLGFELAAEYRGEQSYTVSGGDLTVSQIPLTGSIMLFVPVTPNFQPYGLLFHL